MAEHELTRDENDPQGYDDGMSAVYTCTCGVEIDAMDIDAAFEHGREASQATPIVYVSVNGGIADVGIYSADGTPIDARLAGVTVIQIDWDNVKDEAGLGDPSGEREYVKGLLDREELPPRLHNDIALSYDEAVE